VHWPDGHAVTGIVQHIDDIRKMFAYAPDTRIKQHPMTLADGNVIQPTGKAFKIPMCTVGRWNDQGVMEEEFLFWDNATYMKQLGVE
jgi:hypothetical protein